MIPIELPGCGTLYSWTVIGNREDAPEGFEEFVPYALGIIELDVPSVSHPVRVIGRLTDIPRILETGELDRSYIEIGARVEMVTRVMRRNGRKGLIEYGPLWRLTLLEEVRNRFSDTQTPYTFSKN